MKVIQYHDSLTHRGPIYCESGIVSNKEILIEKALNAKLILLVGDEVTGKLHFDSISKKLVDKDVVELILLSGEQHKTWESVTQVIDILMLHNADRTAVIVSVGGGLVGDIAGFAASIYMRGIDWLHYPTTLLSQVDAAVGGKTGFNYKGIKNILGTFYFPAATYIDTRVLNTLPDREYKAGLAEVIKYGMIADKYFFEWLEANVEGIKQREENILNQIIYKCCILKRDIVGQDEKDFHHRKILNFGHTFAHAIESVTNFQVYLHGEAVSLGMLMATKLSEKLSLVPGKLTLRLERLLEQFDLPVTYNRDKIKLSEIYQFLKHDKKRAQGVLQLVLPVKLGEVQVVAHNDKPILLEAMDNYAKP